MGHSSQLIRFIMAAWMVVAVYLAALPAAAGIEKNSTTVVIGGIPLSSEFEFLEKWRPTFETFLTETVGKKHSPSLNFKLVPLTQRTAFTEVENGQVDFLFTNPASAACLEAEFGVEAAATLRNIVHGQECSHFAGVILTRADNDAIVSVNDLKGRILEASSMLIPGAGLLQWQEMQNNKLDIFADSAQIRFVGEDQSRIVHDVLHGTADVGFVRSGYIDDMVARNLTSWENFKVISSVIPHDSGICKSEVVSTAFVPEWPLMATKSVPRKIRTAVGSALMQISATDPAAIAGGYAGWDFPMSYSSVALSLWEVGVLRPSAKGGRQCARFENLHDIISCPAGFFKRSQAELEGRCAELELDCPEGYQCVCSPCMQADEVAVLSARDNALCKKMEVCTTARQGEALQISLQDNLRRGADLNITLTLHSSQVNHVEAAWLGGEDGAYMSTLHTADRGRHLLTVRAKGKELPNSPFFVEIVDRDCAGELGADSQRVADERGGCVCDVQTVELNGICVSVGVLIRTFLLQLAGAASVAVASYVVLRGRGWGELLHMKVQRSDVSFVAADGTGKVEVIGKGQHGVVLKATFRGCEVAVKCLARDLSDILVGTDAAVAAAGKLRLPRTSSGHSLGSVCWPSRSASVASVASAFSDTATSPLEQALCPQEPTPEEEALAVRAGFREACRSLVIDTEPRGTQQDTTSPGSARVRRQGDSAQAEPGAGGCEGEGGPQHHGWRAPAPSPAHGPPAPDRGGAFGELTPARLVKRFSLVGPSCATASLGLSWQKAGSMSQEQAVSFSGASLARFQDEMRSLIGLRHPCIATLMGLVVDDGGPPLIVMELMEHGSLRGLLNNKSITLDAMLIAPMVRDVIQGMAFLHASRPCVVHGDLKSDNVLVDCNFRAKVADFGMSNMKSGDEPVGTPPWMAPELLAVVRGQPSTATDVYAFGVLLWEMATREFPYREELEEGMQHAAILDEVRLGKRRPRVPAGVDGWITAIMEQCWAQDPAARPRFAELNRTMQSRDIVSFHAAAMQSLEKFKADLDKSEAVLRDSFPEHVVQQLREGKQVASERKEEVTIFFSDIVGYTDISSKLEPHEVSDMLHRLYQKLDALAHKHRVFKMGIIGDAWMGVTNISDDQNDCHASAMAHFALDAVEAARATPVREGDPSMGFVQIRGGFHSGPVVADVVGTTSLQYCLFGDTVNTASRMESTSEAMAIQCSATAALFVRKQDPGIPLSLRGRIAVKGKGSQKTFWVGRHSAALRWDPAADATAAPKDGDAPAEA